MFFNLGPAEMMIILALALIVFGPKKLPEIGRGIGNALREFNKARNDFMHTIQSEVDRDELPAYSPPSYTEEAGAGSGYSGYGYDETGGGLETPAPLEPESADALPYGSDFNVVEGDSQPSFRTGDAEPASLGGGGAHQGERQV